MKKKFFKSLLCLVIMVILVTVLSVTVFAAGDVSGAIEQTWTTAQSQIRSVVDKVVFPVVDTILAILFFVKLGTAYFDYRKHGQFEFSAPAILFKHLITPSPVHHHRAFRVPRERTPTSAYPLNNR